MKSIFIQGIGLIAPGLPGWSASRDVLAGQREWVNEPVELSVLKSLPANERRRVGRLSKLAINAAFDALQDISPYHTDYASIFSSSCGDLTVVDNICVSLSQDAGVVSPTQFHNSVHNAQAGYWAISQQIQKASNSICAYTGGFAAGLLEAYSYLIVESQPVLLIVYDSPGPDRIKQFSPTQSECAVALLLSPERDRHSQVELNIACQPDDPGKVTSNSCENTRLEALRLGCPAARALPLLEGLIRHRQGEVMLPYISHLHVKVAWKL